MSFHTATFYVFSAILIFAALRVVTTRNPVHAALWLVLCFFTAAGVWLLHHPPDRWGGTYGPNDRFLYSLFYCSQATFQLGGKYWNGFFPPVLDMLIAHQQPDGSWQSELPLDVVYGPSYATALAVLTLTTPNQLLPIFQR